MKLLIDVKKDYYEMIKYNVEHGQEYKPFEIIANGIPYEEKRGKWIEGENGNIKCDQCGCEIRFSYLIGGNPDFPKFCCECGAKMKTGAKT